MARVRRTTDGRLTFFCPGCKAMHGVGVGRADGPRWQWDGRVDLPSLFPSILVKTGHYCSGQEGKDCWCTYEQRLGKPAPFQCIQCHSYVEDGNIRFLSDCSHSLAGQTVPLPELKGE